jgi:hypothetical protein
MPQAIIKVATAMILDISLPPLFGGNIRLPQGYGGYNQDSLPIQDEPEGRL